MNRSDQIALFAEPARRAHPEIRIEALPWA